VEEIDLVTDSPEENGGDFSVSHLPGIRDAKASIDRLRVGEVYSETKGRKCHTGKSLCPLEVSSFLFSGGNHTMNLASLQLVRIREWEQGQFPVNPCYFPT
jgi:hypothetical protein